MKLKGKAESDTSKEKLKVTLVFDQAMHQKMHNLSLLFS